MGGLGVVPSEAWDHTHPEHAGWVLLTRRCYAQPACPRHPFGLIDGRCAGLITPWVLQPSRRARSIAAHRHDTQLCRCAVPHYNCYAADCHCPRHRGEIH